MKPWRLALFVGLLVAALYASFTTLDGGVWKRHHTVSVVILVPSLCLWALARYQLGSSFSVRPEARQLVTHGLYARIRNPIYLFGWIFNAGLVLFFGRPLLVLLLLPLVPLQLVRVRREERVLDAAFGDTYRAYKRRTWF
jgi:protein-S-isoprenylcysteine O-methyltransferase Ste14